MALAVVALLVLAPSALGTTFDVTATEDSIDSDPGDGRCSTVLGACTLRAAVMEANADVGADRVDVPAGDYRLLLTGPLDADGEQANDLDLRDDLTVAGSPDGGSRIDGMGLDRIFDSSGADLTLRDLELSGGKAVRSHPDDPNDLLPTEGAGGAVRFVSGPPAHSLSLSGVTLADSTASGSGGGVLASGAVDVAIEDSVIRDNHSGLQSTEHSGFGGGVAVQIGKGGGSVTVDDSEVTGNRAEGPGIGLNSPAGGGLGVGAGRYDEATLEVSDSHIDRNIVENDDHPYRCSGAGGGGVFAAVPARVQGSTFDHNSIPGCSPQGDGALGGGGWASASQMEHDLTLEMTDSEVIGNQAAGPGGGVIFRGGSLRRVKIANNSGRWMGGGVAAFPDRDGGSVKASIYDSEISRNSLQDNSPYPLSAPAAGGGVFGATRVVGSSVVGNSLRGLHNAAQGGGVSDVDQVVDSTISSNSVEAVDRFGVSGGGVAQALRVEGSTIANNSVAALGNGSAEGGGLAGRETEAILNSTISGNQASGSENVRGGGIRLALQAPAAMSHSTIASNDAYGARSSGGNISSYISSTFGSALRVRASVVADGSAQNYPNCLTPPSFMPGMVSEGFNVEDADDCGFHETGDQVNADPLLGPLADNGGLTATMAPRPGSPAIDAVAAGCPPPDVDQRGVQRPVGPRCDSGAVEGSTDRSPGPHVSIVSGPTQSGTNDRTPTFVFETSTSSVSLECTFDDEPRRECSGGAGSDTAQTPLEDGTHKFTVSPSQSGAPGASRERYFEVDATAPETEITKAPPPVNNYSRGVDFRFRADEDSATFRCTFDRVPVSCEFGFYQRGPEIADGDHEFTVASVDRLGNIDPTPARASFRTDTVRPIVELAAPPAYVSDSRPKATYASDDDYVTFTCQFDSAGFHPCSHDGARPDEPLPDGEHTFEVIAKDRAGNDSREVGKRFIVDTSEPETTIDYPYETQLRDPQPRFRFHANGGPVTFQCALDSPTFGDCSEAAAYRPSSPLSDGSHELRVIAIDRAGNTERSPAVVYFTVDTQPPTTALGQHPTSLTADPYPRIYFSSPSDPPARFRCGFDSAEYEDCYGDQGFRRDGELSDGRHEFRVYAIDSVGNADSTPVVYDFVVDATKPALFFSRKPLSKSSVRRPRFRFEASDAHLDPTLQCQIDGQTPISCSRRFRPAEPLAPGKHEFSVRAFDSLGQSRKIYFIFHVIPGR